MNIALLLNWFRTYGKYSYLPAIAFGLAGGIALGVTATPTLLYGILLAIGGIFLLLWLLWVFRFASGFWGRRSTQSSANVLLTTLAVLIILGVINFLAYRYPLTADLTENQRHTLAPQTQTLVKELEKPLKVWLFDDSPSEQDKKLLQNYQQFNAELSYEFVNPDRRPKLVQEFNVQNNGDVFIEYGDKKQLVQSLISFQQREPLSEIELTNAIAKIRRTETPQIYLVQGHGELPLDNDQTGLSQAITALENQGFAVQPLNLITDVGIPDNADALVIAGPERKFLPPEIKALQAYSEAGGNLLIMVSPEVDSGLEPLLQAWGVRLDRRVVIDLSGAGSVLGLDPTIPIVNRYGEHPITENLKGAIAILPLARPVATTEKPNISATTLLEASEAMYATQAIQENLQPTENDLIGPFDIAVALERQKTETTPQPSASPSPSPSPSVSPTLSPTSSSSPSPTASPASSPSPSATPTTSPTPGPSPSPTASPASSPSSVNSPKPTPTSQPSASPKTNVSPAPSPKASPSPTTTPNTQSQKGDGDRALRMSRLIPLNLAKTTVAQAPTSPSPPPTTSPSPEPTASPQSISPSPSPKPTEASQPTSATEEKTDKAPTKIIPPAKMVVMGSAIFASNAWFNEAVNGDLFLNSVQWLAEDNEQPLSIRAKDPTDRRINLSPLQASLLGWLTWVMVPLLGLSLAVWTWWRRR